MRRFIGVLMATAALVAITAVPALAARPDAECPAAASGYLIVGQQEWWDRTVDGFISEGIEVYVGGDPANGFTEEFDAFATAAGFDGAQGLYDFVWVDQWMAIDKNDDLMVCMKSRPITPGNPAYFFNGVDNTAG
jgi:hypothetical protein